ncbi:MAG TPA: Fic family protein [Kiritimatiellia bacterium]|nr:Fic family protein [Kiritimatiellia bacterium]HMO99362.1 Fic family protein [Kiritimatiellia bacterium]HMP95651.1 Fic family protein [Kiritimatiellia bacterium]
MEYQKTHPWIRFSLTLPLDNFRLWLKLGEIASKIEHLAGAPLRPDVAAELNKVYLAKGAMATTAIEGNTLSEEQVKLLVDGKLELPPSQSYLQTEVQNILDVCNEEVQALIRPSGTPHPGLCVELIKGYNRSVLKGLEPGEDVVPGEIRRHSVLVGNVYRGAPAQDCAYLLEKLCEWLNGPDFAAPDKELEVPFALVKAVVAHIYLAWIHPFGDGNGRTARLVEFHILLASGVPVPAAHLLSDHYNLTRTQYYRELAKASASGGDLLPFISYALGGFLDGMREQIRRVREQQMRVAWENFIHDKFREFKSSKTHKRRRDVVLELSEHDWVEVSKIEMLTPSIARDYAVAGDRMVQRDLNAIAKLGLIERRHGKVKANKHLIQAFLPARAQVKGSKR